MRYVQVLINSIDVTDYVLGLELAESRQELFNVDEVKLKLKRTVTTAQAINETLAVEVWGGQVTATDKKLFKGTITSITRQPWGFEVQCMDQNYQCVKRNINKYYLASTDPTGGALNEMVKDMIVNYAELNADNTSVDDPGLVIDEFPCRDTDVAERIKVLSAAANFITYYDAETDKVNWRVLRYTTNANNINIGGASNNVIKYDPWKRITEGWLINRLNLRGSFEYPTLTEAFNGDGVTTEFSVSYVPEAVDVYINGVQKLGGKEGFSTGYDYYIRKEDKKIVFTVAPAVGVTNVRIAYTYKSSTPIQVSDEASIAQYGIHETTITFTDIMNVVDAEKIADSYVQAHKDPIRTTSVYIKPDTFNTNDYKLNDQLTVDDNFHNEMDGEYVITSISFFYPDRPVKVTISDKPLRSASMEENTFTRLKRLEELSVQSTDILTVLSQREHDMTLERDQLVLDHVYVNDSFILGHPINGLLGMGVILDDFEAGVGTWVGVGGAISSVLDPKVGTKAAQCLRGAGFPGLFTSTNAYGDISAYTGVANGAPTQGTIGLWIKHQAGAPQQFTLRIGSDLSNYTEIAAVTYDSSLNYGDETYQVSATYRYLVFRLLNGTTTGNPDWTNCDYTRIAFPAGPLSVDTIDYLTISKSNYIGLNGLGERITTYNVLTQNY